MNVRRGADGAQRLGQALVVCLAGEEPEHPRPPVLRRRGEAIENVGTRHRAAYRFVNDHPDGLAVVVSQDGGVTFVASRAGDVVFWEQSVTP